MAIPELSPLSDCTAGTLAACTPRRGRGQRRRQRAAEAYLCSRAGRPGIGKDELFSQSRCWLRQSRCVCLGARKLNIVGVGSFSRAYKYNITPSRARDPALSPSPIWLRCVCVASTKRALLPLVPPSDVHECPTAFGHEPNQCTPLLLYCPQSCASAGAQANHQNGAIPLEHACPDLALTTYATHLSVPARRLSLLPTPPRLHHVRRRPLPDQRWE